jgi:hypothetical protein
MAGAANVIVLCANSQCGAILRTASTASLLHTVVQSSEGERYFVCPRCNVRCVLGPERRRTARAAEASSAAK